mgnify:CR=1 FL=1|tara:strand:+ start:15081 stop:15827 length:747 start_codon:yes stop_codon:yes gene_type:complete
MNLLENRLAVITGAASGIGEASANLFAENGAKVLAFDLDDSIIEKFKDNNSITGFKLDIASSSAPEIISNTIQEVLGGLDILMNNAGVVSGSPIEEMQDEEWDKVFAVNVEATIKITRCSLPYLKKSKFGRIINIGSIMSSLGDAGLSAYAASKHAVAGLTKSIAAEVGPAGITANYIQPGAIMTGMTREAFKVNEYKDFWTNRSAVKRLGQPIDIAKGALFLASDLGEFVSGHGLVVDGGALVAGSW